MLFCLCSRSGQCIVVTSNTNSPSPRICLNEWQFYFGQMWSYGVLLGYAAYKCTYIYIYPEYVLFLVGLAKGIGVPFILFLFCRHRHFFMNKTFYFFFI